MTEHPTPPDGDAPADRSGGRATRLVAAVSVGAVLLLGVLWAVGAWSSEDDGTVATAPSTGATVGQASPDPTATAPTGTGSTPAAPTSAASVPAVPATPGTAPGDSTVAAPDDGEEPDDGAAPGGPAAPAGAPVTADAAVTAGCRVVGDDLEALLTASGRGDVEPLRVAVPLLDERLQALESVAADTGGDLSPLLEALRDLREAWTTAIASADAGDEAASRAALDRADTVLAEVDRAATASGLGDEVCG